MNKLKFIQAFLGLALVLMLFSSLNKAEALPRLSFTSQSKGNIFPSDDGAIELKLDLSNPIVSGHVVVSDESGRVINDLRVPEGIAQVRIPLQGRGFYTIKASVSFRDGVKEEVSTTSATIGGYLPDAVRASSHIGIWHVSGDPSLALSAGARWTRKMLTLKNYKLDDQGRIIAQPWRETLDKRFSWIGTLAFGLPPWIEGRPLSAKPDALYAPRDWDKLEGLVKQFAQDIPDFPDIFELYNEPELHWNGNLSDLVKFQSVLAKGIKSVHPGTKVIGPCLYSIRVPDLKKLVDLGLLDYLDGLSMHGYVNGTPPEAEFIERVIHLKQYLHSIGKDKFPIYITEFGWGTGVSREHVWKFVDELTQARYISRAVSLLNAQDVTSIVFVLLWKTDKDDGNFSLLHDDLTPKPAYAAFANVSKWLAGATNPRRIRISDTTNMLLFDKEGGTIAVTWNVADNQSVFFPQAGTKFEDMMGRPLTSNKILSVTTSPLFGWLQVGGVKDIISKQSLKAQPGDTLILHYEKLWLPWPLSVHEAGKIVIPPDTKSGAYVVFGKRGDRVDVFEVTVS